MELYLMYLRKSRMDLDFDEVSVRETLNRHRKILEAFCRERKLNVVEVLEEVVSGESLSSRPEMLRLLELVNTGLYAGVICIDIERLSRGSSLESGYIMQVFQANNCKIVTPSKIYDLQNEADEQFTDMKFMFSRYELKTITKRLVRGRNQSASEGKFMGSIAPYGYRAYKLPGVKGNSLEIVPDEAKIVRMIYDMYGQQGIGYNTIAYQLNEMHIPSLNGSWGQTSITNILSNEVYLGKIRWRREPTKRIIRDGMVVKKRVLNNNYELYDGLHEPIITQEQWERVVSVRNSRNHSSVHSTKQLSNPFATILFCEKCGATLKRNVPGKSQKTTPWYRCPTRGCDCRAIKCHVMESSVISAMESWLHDYLIYIGSDVQSQNDHLETALGIIRSQLSDLQMQQDKICDLLEKGVYTVEMFSKRNASLVEEIRKAQTAESDLLKKCENQSQVESEAGKIIPATQHILDNYEHLSPAEKNNLWKIVLEKVSAYRTPDGELSVHIYLKLPMKK
ncbi:recombinase family protein [Faecalicatena orotica]|uniref:recombinase family protein n=1 Tax=Faecalicatena orotica TaxID=1544 RepID=UPI003217146D